MLSNLWLGSRAFLRGTAADFIEYRVNIMHFSGIRRELGGHVFRRGVRYNDSTSAKSGSQSQSDLDQILGRRKQSHLFH